MMSNAFEPAVSCSFPPGSLGRLLGLRIAAYSCLADVQHPVHKLIQVYLRAIRLSGYFLQI